AETKEALGGFYMVEAKDLDEAIEWAARIPGARRGSIEVRPVWELPAEYQEAVGDPRIQALSN
ncbi:MAG: YciI family protein, partial [Chloroflexota bacterium]